MDLPNALNRITEGGNLSREESAAVMGEIMSGRATPAQIGAFLVGLRMKGETVEEITGAAETMRALATPVTVERTGLVDTCGTGGDARGTFNVSTAAALVAAAAGARVAKHGNRSVSSHSGSADVLEAAGVNLELTPEQVARCIDSVGVGFLFAPAHHGAMRHAIGPRRELKIRTLFNLLGPLTNPASAPNQVLGVFSERWVRPMADVLAAMGSEHVLVVHARDGLDEISIGAPTAVAELRNGSVRSFTLEPETFGFRRTDVTTLRVETAEESLAVINDLLAGREGPARDIVCLNAGAAVYAAGLAEDLAGGIGRATEAVASGEAARVFRSLVDFSQAQRP